MKKFIFIPFFILLLIKLTALAAASVMPSHKLIDFTSKIAFSEEEKAYLDTAPTLKVAVLKDYYPYEYVDNYGVYKGITSTYLYEIERETGIKFEIIPYNRPIDAISAFNEGEVDLFSLAIDSKIYKESKILSRPYAKFSMGIFTNSENRLLINSMEDLKGKKIAVSKSTLIFNPVSNKDFQLFFVDGAVEGLRGVNRGIYDAYIGDVFHTKSIIVRMGMRDIYLSYIESNKEYHFSIAADIDNEEFVPIINKVISKFNHLNQQQVMEIWTVNNIDTPNIMENTYKKHMFFISVFFLSVLAGFYLWLLQIRIKAKKINELRKDYKNLFDATPVAMFIYRNNKITYVNNAFSRLVGEDEKSLLNGNSFEYINAAFIKPARKNHSDKKNDTEEDVKIYDVNGNVKYINLKNINIKMGNQNHELVIAVDVTSRKVLEDERRDILTKVASIQKMESVGLLASKVAHDFNNILAGVNGAAEYMYLNLKKEDQLKKYPEIIMNACKRATYLTKQLLFFSKDKMHVLRNIDLNKCVEEGVALLIQAIKNNSDIEVVSKINAKESNIIGNEDLLENIIINLGLNSKDALAGKSGKIIIETKNVFLSRKDAESTMFEVEEGDYVRLSVEDNGSGIPYDIQDKIFEPFYTTKGVDKGNGLGLFAVYGVVREHRATLKLKSTPDEGTKISIFFPLSKSENKIKAAKKSSKKIKAKVLIVDDEDILLTILKDILEFLGAKVVTARNYDEAIEQYKSNQDIDIVMQDVVMPIKGGLDVYKKLREINKNIKVIFMSGYSSDTEINDMIPRNKNLGFIAKPYNVSEVSEKISEMLKK